MSYSVEQPWLPFSEVQWDWDFGFHDLMLSDELRMRAYRKAIQEVVKKGDVVLDLGAGTGILSEWALAAGADRVYGIDVDPTILSMAVDRIGAAGYGAKFIPINKVSFEATLPEKVDVIISEIMGNIGDNEGFQTILSDAFERFVKPNGRAIPYRVTTFLVPVSAEHAHERVRNKHISTLNENYNIDNLLDGRNLTSAFNLYYDTIIAQQAYLSEPQQVKEYYDRWQQPSVYSKHLSYEVQNPGVFTGFKGYFVAQLSDQVALDISGDDIVRRTTSDSWKHAYLPIEQVIPVEKGDRITLTFTRRDPVGRSQLEQIYRWQGQVTRNGTVVAEFDQCLDEAILASDDQE